MLAIPGSSDDPITLLLHNWLMAKFEHTGSEKTKGAYGDVMNQLRADLRASGLDLNSAPKDVAPFVERWASAPRRESRASVSLATKNQRLSIISSFYTYAVENEALDINPLTRIKRAKVQEYASAEPLEREEIERAFKAINLDTPIGRRDLALLLVAFTTGRRASELAQLSVGDLFFAGDSMMARWRHMKGGKAKTDGIERDTAKAVVRWLASWYGPEWPDEREDAPIWIRIEGDEFQRGQRLSYQGIRLIFQRRFGPSASKIHISRHSFALMYLQSKKGELMRLKEILGHESLDTTFRYARHLLEGRETDRVQIGGAFGFGEYESKAPSED